MKKSNLSLYSVILLTFLITGCLTVEKKEYTFELKDSKSGTLTIKFINIMSMMDDTMNVSDSDFTELISTYIDGDQLETDFEPAVVKSKRLFEEGGMLCGEAVIEFNELNEVGLYQYDEGCPIMFNVSSFLESETFLSSNGEYGGEIMPVVFWEKSLKTLKLTTTITAPDETTIGLLSIYNQRK
jgi:hypothetical protein